MCVEGLLPNKVMTIEEARKLLRDSREKLYGLRGTLLLIEVDIMALERWLEQQPKKEPEWLNQALNEGDGTYKP